MTDPLPPLVWDDNPGSKYCGLTALNGVDRQYEIKKGISRLKDFPVDAYFNMDKQYKKQVALSDNLANIEGMPVLSNRLKAFVQARNPSNVEFLTVQIRDHKDKQIKDAYHIMNPMEVVDCIDKDKSRLMWNPIDKDMIAGVYSLVLKIEKINPELLLFRPKYLERRVFVRNDFAEEIRAGGFTGVEFREILGYVG
jgi:hypothetical protein